MQKAGKKADVFWPVGVCIVLLLSIIYPRIVYLGNFPHMDEGYYAWQAMHIHAFLANGKGLPPDGGLALYPLMLSWLCNLEGSILIWMRIADLLAALISGLLYCMALRKICENEKLALFLAFVFIGAMNIGGVIDGGYKNSIGAAYIPLFLALLLTRDDASPIRFFFIGSLVALGVLLREPFAIFAILGFFAIWSGWNCKSALFYAAGGLMLGAGIFCIIGFGRGDILGLVNGYLKSANIYATQSHMVTGNFLGNGEKAIFVFLGPILVTLYGFFICGKGAGAARQRASHKFWSDRIKKRIFWICTALLPLLEPALKVGFLYHFAVCLPGMGGLSALNWKNLAWPPSTLHSKFACLVIILSAIQICMQLPIPAGLRHGFNALANISDDPWEGRRHQSNTLTAAQKIDSELPSGKGTLATSGFTYFLYGATGKLPPQWGFFASEDSGRLSDLGRSFAAMGKDTERMALALQKNPPDMVALGYAVESHEPAYFSELQEAIRKSGIYEEVSHIRPDKNKNYGWMGYKIFRKKRQGSIMFSD